MQAYQDYFDGKLEDHHLSEEQLTADLKKLEGLPTV
jgi:tryptophan synthase beta chain